ncbi:MAG: hypothetical protein GYA23_09385 [Methanomicrobiales archaeon]|nr:hypothetical protein [Methanomicrobiales archaeon]
MRNPGCFLLALLVILFLAVTGCTDTDDHASAPATAAAPKTGSGVGGGSASPTDVQVAAFDAVVPAAYLQMPALGETFVDFSIHNPTGSSRTYTIESEIPGYTEKAVNTVTIPAGASETVGQTPTLKNSAIPREMTPASFRYRIALSDGTLVEEQTLPVSIYAKDTMIWAVSEGEETTELTPYIGAWVTPHATGIDTLIRDAAEYHPGKGITGYQCGAQCTDEQWEEDTNSQVKAIFESLKNDYKIVYINSPFAYGKTNENVQRVRLPADSLTSKSANCIDGTVLYASALESIGMNPRIIVLPEHAFLCYDTKPDDPSHFACLETTMTSSATFEEALKAGEEAYQDEMQKGRFTSGESNDLSVAQLRTEGIRPMV